MGKSNSKRKGRRNLEAGVDKKLSLKRRRKELDSQRHQQSNAKEEQRGEKKERAGKRPCRGRPSLKPEGPMNEEELKERKRESQSKKRRDDVISEVRRNAVKKRWDNDDEPERKGWEGLEEEGRYKEVEDEVEIQLEKKEKKKGDCSERTVQRWQADLMSVLPTGFSMQLDLLSQIVGQYPDSRLLCLNPKLPTREGKSFFYRKLLSCCPYSQFVIRYWAACLSCTDYGKFREQGLSFSLEKDIPMSVLLKDKADQIKEKIWKDRKRESVRHLALDHAFQTYSQVVLARGAPGGKGLVTSLALAIESTKPFAKQVISAHRAGEGAVQALYKRKRRKGSVGTDVLGDLRDFLELPHVSRCCPGESVSMGYNIRKQKHRMKVTRESALSEFLSKSEHTYSIKTLMQYWPKNFVTVSSHDRQRNVCPVHDNFSRLLEGLHAHGVAKNIPSSCRVAASFTQCPGGQEPLEPLSWTQSCAMGECAKCPELPVELEGGVDVLSLFTFQEWRKGPTPRLNEKGEPREVFTLHNTTITLTEGIELAKKQAKELATHIFTAYNQWEAKRVLEANIGPGTLMQLDDYQNNITVELGSTTTSTAYGGNQVHIAVFPVVLCWREEEGGPLRKATITFLSDDLHHDHQQVWRMEKRAAEIVAEKTGLDFDRLFRPSDGCGAQYKSRFVNGDLVDAGERILGKPGAEVILMYFASNEGKSESDSSGSALKLRVEGMVLRDPSLVIQCARHMVEAVRKVTPDTSPKYQFHVVEEFPAFERVRPEERNSVKLTGIRKIHEIGLRSGNLVAKTLSCLECCRLQIECDSCSQTPPTITADKLAEMLGRGVGGQEGRGVQEQEETEMEQEVLGVEVDLPDDLDLLEPSDGEGEGEDEEENEVSTALLHGCTILLSQIEVEDVVWGLKYGKRAPAKVQS